MKQKEERNKKLEENVYEVLQEAEKLFLDAGNELKAKLRCDIEIARCWAGEVLTLDENHNLIKKGLERN